MEDKKEFQDFDLDDILSEFGDSTQEDSAGEDFAGDLDALLGEWGADADAEPVKEEAQPEAPAEKDAADTAAAEEAGSPEAPENLSDTGRMRQLIEEIAAENETAEDAVAQDETIRMDAMEDLHQAREHTVEEVSEDETIRMDAVSDDDTIRMDTEEEAQEEAPAAPAREPARTVYNPRLRLRELKKKLVSGPEKRYYELSEAGIGRLQVAIVINLVLVGLCVAITTMYAAGLFPENRLRFVIFSQILSMLLSALMGCHQILDGLGDLFRGRFNVNTLLFFTQAACCADAVFCLSELRIPCCAAFSLEITMALWARYQRRTTETAQMDTLRKAVRLHGIVKVPDFYEGKPGILRREGEVEDFMDHYTRASGPEKVQGLYALISLLLSIAIAVLAGINHGISLALQVLAAALLVAVPASSFVALSRPAALLERRLHMVGAVICGWRGVKGLCGKAAFPLRDEDLFPAGSTKLNGVKFYGDRNSDEVIAYATSLISVAGGSLTPVFRQMLEGRDGKTLTVKNFRSYGNGGIGGDIRGESVLVGSMDFLQDMGVSIPEGTMVNQAVYVAIDDTLCAVFAISYAKMRSCTAGIVSLCGNRKLNPVIIGSDFMLTGGLLRAKFSVNTRRILFPSREVRQTLSAFTTDYQEPTLALSTRDDLSAYAYTVSGARALRTACNLGVAVHLFGGILGLVMMAALAFLGTTELLTPTHILLYQLVWMVPGLLITEWTRTV